MIVVKKINNNVAVCRDGNNRELVAFGKGIGFPAMPYELTDLSKVDRTFYDIGQQFLPMLNDISAEVIEFTARQMDMIRNLLPYETSPNLVLTLADHLAFAMERAQKGVYIQMPSIYDMELNYPLEIRMARYIVSTIEKEFKCHLPRNEVQGVAMQFINARNNPVDCGDQSQMDLDQQYDDMIEQATQIIETELDVTISRSTFNYARLATHLQYLLKRLFEHQHISSDNLQMYYSIRDQYPEVAACIDKISEYCNQCVGSEMTEEEKLYLIMHVNRVCGKKT